MRHAFTVALLLSVAVWQGLNAVPYKGGALLTQDKAASSAVPSKKGDAIAISGCLRGSSLEATDMGSGDDINPVVESTTFRLTGDKALLKEMKEKHEKKVVEIRGVLKSDLQPGSWGEKTVGNTRISIGTPSTGSASAAEETKRPVPVVEVKSYEGRSVPCGR
jgi:hypothetical protein